MVAPGGQGSQRQAATSLEFWQESLHSQAGGAVLFLSAYEPDTVLRERHEGLTTGKGGQPQAGGTERQETRSQRAGALGFLPAPLGVSWWHISRGSGGKPGCRIPLCPHCTWLHHFLQKFLTNTDIGDRSGKGGAWTWRHRLGSGVSGAMVSSHHCQRYVQDFCGSTQPVLCQPSDPLTTSPPQMSFPKATVQKLRGISSWELFLAVFSSC